MQSRIAKLRPHLEGKRVTFEQFAEVFITSLPDGVDSTRDPSRKADLVHLIRRLKEMFLRIDANAVGTISWEQFTAFASDNLFSTGMADRVSKGTAPIVYRQSQRLQTPSDDIQELPTARVTCMKWVPELQQLFVAYNEYSTLFVFNHLCRLIARIHANMPPTGTPMTASQKAITKTDEKAAEEVLETIREKYAIADARSGKHLDKGIPEAPLNLSMRTKEIDTYTWKEGQEESKATVETTRRMQTTKGEEEDDESETSSIAPSIIFSLGGIPDTFFSTTRPVQPKDLKWARGILASRSTLSRGDRMKAASIVANALCVAEARKGSLLRELGADADHRHSSASALQKLREAQQALRAENLTHHQRMQIYKSPTADTTLSAERSIRLYNAAQDLVARRREEAQLRAGYVMERATLQGVLYSHPAGFTDKQAQRLKKMSVKDLGEASSSLLPIMGIKGTGKVLWDKTRRLLNPQSGFAFDAQSASNIMEERRDGLTLEQVSGGRPQASASAAMVAYDAGATGKVRDFGYLIEVKPRFLYDRACRDPLYAGSDSAAATTLAVASGRGPNALKTAADAVASVADKTSTAKHLSRTDILATPHSKRNDVSLLAVEYCMPVDASQVKDPKQWRMMKSSSVHHLLVISSSELYLTLWDARTFEYAGVIHVLLPQERMVWSSGANLLFTCNTFVGPVSGWDVISGSKVCQLASHDAPVQAMLDIPSLGLLATASLDTKIFLWSYRADTDSAGGELAGVRGRFPPRVPYHTGTLDGHNSGVSFIAGIDDPINCRVISASVGGELCFWDAGHCLLLGKVAAASSKDVSLSSLAVTSSVPPMAVTVDDANTVRLWTIELNDHAAYVGECVDYYRLSDVPFRGACNIVIPRPHPHVILGGRRLMLLGPCAPSDASASDGLADGGPVYSHGSLPPGFQMPVGVVYCASLSIMVVAEGEGLAVYDCRTGERKKRFPMLLPDMLVALSTDKNARRLFVGDTSGTLAMVNSIDGKIVATANPPHKDDVTCIVPVVEDSLAFTVSWDRSLRVYEYGEHRIKDDELPCIRIVENAHAADITCLDVNRNLGLVATGAADGTLRIWDYCSLDLIATLQGHTSGVSTLAFAKPETVPLLISADDSGFIYMWAVRGSNYPDRLLLGLRNLGRAAGPFPPSQRIVNIKALKSKSNKERRVILDGVLNFEEEPDFSETIKDPELSALFKNRQEKAAKTERTIALSGVLKQEIANSERVKQESMLVKRMVTRAALLRDDQTPQISFDGAKSSFSPSHFESPQRKEPVRPTSAFPPTDRSRASLVGTSRPGSALPTSSRPSSAAPETPEKLAEKWKGDTIGVPVPITSLSVYCSADVMKMIAQEERKHADKNGGNKDEDPKAVDDSEGNDFDKKFANAEAKARQIIMNADTNVFDVPLVLKVFSGDGQGVIKHWDLSNHLMKFMKNGATGVGIIPPSRYASMSGSFNPRQTKHRVYPQSTPAAYDPQVEAERLANEQAAKKITFFQTGLMKKVEEPNEHLMRSNQLLYRLKLQRELYNQSKSKHFKKETKSHIEKATISKILSDSNNHSIEESQRAKAMGSAINKRRFAAQKKTGGTTLSSKKAEMQEKVEEDKKKEERMARATLVAPITPPRDPSQRAGSASRRRYSIPREDPELQAKIALVRERRRSRDHIAPPVRGDLPRLQLQDASQNLAARTRSVALEEKESIVLSGNESQDEYMSGAEESPQKRSKVPVNIQNAVSIMDLTFDSEEKKHNLNDLNGSNAKPDVSKDGGRVKPEYPKVTPFLGVVVYSTFSNRQRPFPILPLFSNPIPDVERRLKADAVGMELEDNNNRHWKEQNLLYSPALKATPRRGPTARTLSTRASMLRLNISDSKPVLADEDIMEFQFVADLPLEVQDELWYSFTSNDPRYLKCKNKLIAVTEDSALDMGITLNEFDGSLVAPGTVTRPHYDASASSASLDSQNQGGFGSGMIFTPSSVWVASRMRLDIRPVATWTAHTDVLTALSFVEEPKCLTSCSLDGSVRLWTPNGLLLGVVSAVPRNNDLERAMAAAESIASRSGTMTDAERLAKNKPPQGIAKENCPWQFETDDAQRVKREISEAENIIHSIASKEEQEDFKLYEQAKAKSLDLNESVSKVSFSQSLMSLRGEVKVEVDTKRQNAEKALQQLLENSKKLDRETLLRNEGENPKAYEARRAIETAEASVLQDGDFFAVSHKDKVANSSSSFDSQIETSGHISESASNALNKALIVAIETWDDGKEDAMKIERPRSSRGQLNASALQTQTLSNTQTIKGDDPFALDLASTMLTERELLNPEERNKQAMLLKKYPNLSTELYSRTIRSTLKGRSLSLIQKQELAEFVDLNQIALKEASMASICIPLESERYDPFSRQNSPDSNTDVGFRSGGTTPYEIPKAPLAAMDSLTSDQTHKTPKPTLETKSPDSMASSNQPASVVSVPKPSSGHVQSMTGINGTDANRQMLAESKIPNITTPTPMISRTPAVSTVHTPATSAAPSRLPSRPSSASKLAPKQDASAPTTIASTVAIPGTADTTSEVAALFNSNNTQSALSTPVSHAPSRPTSRSVSRAPSRASSRPASRPSSAASQRSSASNVQVTVAPPNNTAVMERQTPSILRSPMPTRAGGPPAQLYRSYNTPNSAVRSRPSTASSTMRASTRSILFSPTQTEMERPSLDIQPDSRLVTPLASPKFVKRESAYKVPHERPVPMLKEIQVRPGSAVHRHILRRNVESYKLASSEVSTSTKLQLSKAAISAAAKLDDIFAAVEDERNGDVPQQVSPEDNIGEKDEEPMQPLDGVDPYELGEVDYDEDGNVIEKKQEKVSVMELSNLDPKSRLMTTVSIAQRIVKDKNDPIVLGIHRRPPNVDELLHQNISSYQLRPTSGQVGRHGPKPRISPKSEVPCKMSVDEMGEFSEDEDLVETQPSQPTSIRVATLSYSADAASTVHLVEKGEMDAKEDRNGEDVVNVLSPSKLGLAAAAAGGLQPGHHPSALDPNSIAAALNRAKILEAQRAKNLGKISVNPNAPPPHLREYEVIMWPFRNYVPPRSFGLYTRRQVEKFREVWMGLELNESGNADVECILNAGLFSTSTLKVSKAIFASIDTDKSGDISQWELLKIAFPLCSNDVRQEIYQYIRFKTACEKSERLRKILLREDENTGHSQSKSQSRSNSRSRSRSASPSANHKK